MDNEMGSKRNRLTKLYKSRCCKVCKNHVPLRCWRQYLKDELEGRDQLGWAEDVLKGTYINLSNKKEVRAEEAYWLEDYNKLEQSIS
jgi:hypothetical protein